MEIVKALKEELEERMEREIQCPICLDVMVNPYGLPCMHNFCHECILRSLAIKSECPSCKLPFYKRALGKNCLLFAVCDSFGKISSLVDQLSKYPLLVNGTRSIIGLI